MRELGELAGLLAAGTLPCLAYTGLGLPLARRLAPDARGAEALATAFALGSGLASLAILGLRLVDVPVPLPAVAAVAAAMLPAWRRVLRDARDRPPAARWVRAVDAASVALFALTFVSALGPETFWDGFEYHLPMIAAWSEGPIRALPGVLDAELRAGVDLLYLPAVTAGHPDAAAGVSACFAGALAALVRAEAGRRATTGAAALAGLFVLLAPLTLDNAASSYVDLGVGAYGFLALASVDRWSRGGRERDLVLAAVCVAFAVNAKLHAAVLVPAALGIATLGGRGIGAAPLLRCGAIVLALTVPWLVKAALTSGNPFFPLLGGVFGTGFATPEHLSLRTLRLSTDHPASGPLGLPAYLASVFFGRNPHVSGLLGALPLALLPAAVHRPTRATAVLAGTLGVLFLLQFVFMPALRFGTPLLPFLAIGAAVGGARLAREGRTFARVLAATLALLAVHHTAAAAAFHLPRVAALRDPERHARRVFPDQIALRELVAEGRGVVGIPKGAVLWMPRPVYVLHWERNGELFFDPVLGHRTPPERALALLRRRGVASLVVEVGAAPPGPRRTGHPLVDAWIAAGDAERRRDVAPRTVRGDRTWVLVDLLWPDQSA